MKVISFNFNEGKEKSLRNCNFEIENGNLKYHFNVSNSVVSIKFSYDYDWDDVVIDSFFLDPNDKYVAAVREMLTQNGTAEEVAYAKAVFKRWRINPKDVSFNWILKCTSFEDAYNKMRERIFRIFRNRLPSEYAYSILLGISKKYIRLVLESKNYMDNTSYLSGMEFIKFVLSIDDNSMRYDIMEKEVIPDDDINFYDYHMKLFFAPAVAELRLIFADLCSDMERWGIEMPLSVAASRQARLSALLNRIGVDIYFGLATDELNREKSFTFIWKDVDCGEKGAKEYVKTVYKVADSLGVPHDKIYAETRTVEGKIETVFSEDMDFEKDGIANMYDIPYSDGKTADVAIDKAYCSEEECCTLLVVIKINRHYDTIDQERYCIVTKECFKNGLDIDGVICDSCDNYIDSGWIFTSNRDNDEYFNNKSNLIICSLKGVVDCCRYHEDVIDVIMDNYSDYLDSLDPLEDWGIDDIITAMVNV